MQYQSTSYQCQYSTCPCLYSYCQPHRNSNSSHHYPHTTVHHHYHYLPHSSTSSSSSQCQKCCHNIPTCMTFSPTKHQQPCHCKSSSSNPSPTHRHPQRQYLDPKKYKLLTHSIHELIQSERDYVDDLYIMVEICLAVLLQQKWATARHVAIMSRNSSDILAFHRRLLASFNTSTFQSTESKCQTISQTFLDHRLEFITLYVDYCDGHSKAWNLCTDYRSKSEWSDFIVQCQTMIQQNKSLPSLANKRIRFEDFLIKPIQRICRYQLLLKEIIRYANPPSTAAPSSSSILTEAFHCMHHIATEIDQQNEKKESEERTSRFIQRLESDWRLPRQVVAQLGHLVISGALDIQYVGPDDSPQETSFPSPPPSPIHTAHTVKSRYLGCFVFSSYIIIAHVKKQTLYEAKHWFPLHRMEVIDQDNNEFMLQCFPHVFICTASCPREKQTWIEKIRLARQQQHDEPVGLVSSIHPSPPHLRSTAYFPKDPIRYDARRSHLPTSTSSPSLLIAAEPPRSLSTPLTSDAPRRHSSLDLFTMATHNLNRVSLHFKAHHRHAIRDAVDQRLRDVCTRDYLSSRARYIALDRKSSTTASSPVSRSPSPTSPIIAPPVYPLTPLPCRSRPPTEHTKKGRRVSRLLHTFWSRLTKKKTKAPSTKTELPSSTVSLTNIPKRTQKAPSTMLHSDFCLSH